MATVYLHIGLPKTGTTSIQHFLWDNSSALKEQGISYPDFELHYTGINPYRNGHFLVSYFYGTSVRNYEPVLNRLEKLGRDFDKIILTDESIWRAGENRPELWEKLRNDLEKRGLKLFIIAYLRRQDSFLLSFYRQWIKGSHTSLSFYDSLNELKNMYPLDYFSYINMLSEILGRENLILRVFEKEQFHGPERTLHSDFLDIFNLSLDKGFTIKKEEFNGSLDDTHVELHRLLNSVSQEHPLTPLLRQSFNANAKNSLHSDSYKTSFFHPGEQTAYLDSFAESNRRLAVEYFGRENGILFYDESDRELPEYHIDTLALLEEAIRFYARAFHSLELELDELKNAGITGVLLRLKRKIRRVFCSGSQT